MIGSSHWEAAALRFDGDGSVDGTASETPLGEMAIEEFAE
jgi:hypothetical protein